MPSVVFLRGINVGKTNRCQPAMIAKQLGKFDLVNIGAVGTFVARKNTSASILRAAIAKKLPFKCEIMIVPACDISEIFAEKPFTRQPSGPDVTYFVNVLHKPLLKRPKIPFCLPTNANPVEDSPRRARTGDWQLKVIAIKGRLLLGLYRRHVKAVGYLGKLEKQLGVPSTTRSWNTIEKVVKVLEQR